jgi:hypothetical protein
LRLLASRPLPVAEVDAPKLPVCDERLPYNAL